MKTTLPLLLCILFVTNLFAQKAPIKWGKVDQADLDMKVYEPDPDAEAVILTDFAKLEFDFTTGDILFNLDRHVRIKILKKSAFDRGNIEIPFYAFQNSEKISGLKAQVILPNGEKIQVDKKDKFTEEENKYWSSRKFAFPALEEGCIIEYKYTKKSGQIYYLEDWYFQSDIPTRLSELRTEIPEWFKYISFTQGTSPEIENKSMNKRVTLPRERITTNSNSLVGRGSKMSSGGVEAKINQTRYYLENIPALKRERYITTMQDYYSKLSLQLQSVQFPNSAFQNVSSSWTNVAKELEESSGFGGQLNKKRYTKKLSAAVAPELKGAKDDMEKVAAIYRFISRNIEWNELYGRYSESLDKAFETKTATSGELNMMLIALCRQQGLTAFPILVSTRGHGKVMEYYPKTDQFNHLIAFVQVGEKQFLFDVGSPNRDPSLLRMSSLNYKGWLVDGKNSQWISIPVNTDTEIGMATLNLSPNGDLKGTISQTFKGYCAISERTAYYKNKAEDHKHIHEAWQESYPEVSVNSIEFSNQDKPTETLKCDLQVEVPQAAQVSGDFIYVPPMLNFGWDENPLKLEKRTFPVDIPVKIKDQYILNLTIPEGFAIEELPESVNMKTEGGGARFQFMVSQNGNKIQLISKVMVTKLRYEPTEYDTIKNFFDLVVEKHGEQIVLKKKA